MAEGATDMTQEMEGSPGALQVGGSLSVHIDRLINQGRDPRSGLQHYLALAFQTWQRLPLASILSQGRRISERVTLADLYTPLDVWSTPEREGPSPRAQGKRPSPPESFVPSGGRQRENALKEIARHHRCVLIGDPGSGKSTVSRLIVACMAGELTEQSVGLPLLREAAQWQSKAEERRGKSRRVEEATPSWSEGPRLPIFVELRRLASPESESMGHFPPKGQDGTSNHFVGHLRHEIAQGNVPSPDRVAEALIDVLLESKGTGALIVFDGLDEVAEADERRHRVRSLIESVADTFGAAQILVTARTYAYQRGQEWRLSERFVPIELAPYSDAQVAHYVQRWYRAAERSRPAEVPPGTAEDHASSLVADIRRDHHLAELAERPLLLTMITLVHDSSGRRLPPGGIAELYDETVKLLVERWNVKPGERPLTEEVGLRLDELREALEKIAFAVHCRADPNDRSAADIPATLLRDAFSELCRQKEPTATEQTNPLLNERNLRLKLEYRVGILVSDHEQQYRFPHRSFQEYMASSALVRYPGDLEMPAGAGAPAGVGAPADAELAWEFPGNLARLLHTDPDRWREVAMLAAGRVLQERPRDIWGLLDSLCDGDPPEDPQSPLYWSGLIAGRVLAEHAIRPPTQSRDLRAREGVRVWIRRLVELGALPPLDRAVAGRVLALLGDDRPGVGCKDGIPEIAWVPIPGGPFQMGSDPKVDSEAYEREYPLHSVDLGSFRISRYPITVAQFRPFVEGDGYSNHDYWTRAGLEWRRERVAPELWDDPDWTLDNHPVVGVSWFEAHAYCRWLRARLGCEVRLPTEAEWEKAARGVDGRIYPWGSEYDADRCNVGDTGIGRTSAVGMFPLPEAPWSDAANGPPLDMIGNVWEWCATKWRDSYADPADDRPEGTDSRVLRGAAFLINPGVARCAFRHWSVPVLRTNYIGFRVAAPIGSEALDSDASGL